MQQTLLKHDQYIPELQNEDPGDLARPAAATASSTARYELFDRTKFQAGKDLHPLNMPRAVMFPRGVNDRPGSIFLRLASDRKEPAEIVVHLREASGPADFSSTEDLATAAAVVPPGRESWVEFKLDCTSDASHLWLWLPATEGIAWRMMADAPLGSCRAYGGGRGNPWTVVEGQYYAFFAEPALAVPCDCPPENVTNGTARIVGSTSNLWASDPTEPMPQWVELDFRKPVRMNTVYLTFDTNMDTAHHTVPLVPTCVRDYELSYQDGSEWAVLAAERGNFQRRRVHRFPAVSASRLRLTVQATNGDRSARVFEVRVYDE